MKKAILFTKAECIFQKSTTSSKFVLNLLRNSIRIITNKVEIQIRKFRVCSKSTKNLLNELRQWRRWRLWQGCGGFFGGFLAVFWWDVTRFGTTKLFLILKLSKPVRATIPFYRIAC